MPSTTKPAPKTKKPSRSKAASGGTTPARKTASSSTRTKPAPKSSAATDGAAASITNYTTGLRWLYEHVDHERMRIVRYNERTFNLDRMRKLLELIGNPHKDLKAVQIAGTKGKGSTCAMLASMLQACGYTVGLYTSPHLIDLRERITINGSMISYQDVAEIFRMIAANEKAFGEATGGPPTFFEIMTATALRYFAAPTTTENARGGSDATRRNQKIPGMVAIANG